MCVGYYVVFVEVNCVVEIFEFVCDCFGEFGEGVGVCVVVWVDDVEVVVYYEFFVGGDC